MILVVDDLPQNVRLLEAVLAPRGYEVVSAASGEEALERLDGVDLVLLDVVMPGLDGYEVCRRIRADPDTAFLPVVMITASGEQEKKRALDAGADDFLTKPFDHAELLARVRSLVRLKRYHDEVDRYTAGLRRFLPPEVAELVKADPALLESHRREVAVLVCGLHGFPAFAETAAPEDVMDVLGEYHAALGDVIDAFSATLSRIAGDVVTVVLNDPVPCEDVAGTAVRLSLALRDRVWELGERWTRLGFELSPALGVALGHATIGRIGSDRRWQYAPVGPAPLLAERLAEAAGAGEVLISQRVEAGTEAVTSPLTLQLRGFTRPVAAYDLLGT
ncbi:response regulator [Solirubrobacter sp. CPCC 204708]|uniref:Response regulator n=1 Tax=Solirubrobacter deserti TaxID=2282478 RepID=A0ABT4RKU0_9ACTN|nr:adenylate/guanylate cyclase domain-containing response regulator [Solirubrobacter deserti]MBE2319062.1 response regulator [Solirubrobacter deserti]MDA0139141.1 response regulator [Solirubrobacter deserti]